MVPIGTMAPWIRALAESTDVALRCSPLAGRHLLLMLSAPRHGPQRSVRYWPPSWPRTSSAPNVSSGRPAGTRDLSSNQVVPVHP
jgi:hypothetical protein